MVLDSYKTVPLQSLFFHIDIVNCNSQVMAMPVSVDRIDIYSRVAFEEMSFWYLVDENIALFSLQIGSAGRRLAMREYPNHEEF